MGKGRLEAFSDGVIAIIITIMVLELKAPHGATIDALLPLAPVLFSYVLSFVYVGIYWSNHHHLFQAVRRINGGILWWNLHLLFWLSLLPFVSAWMGDNDFATVPVAAYGVVLLMCAVSHALLEHRLASLHDGNEALALAIGSDRKGWISIALYACGIGLGFVHAWLGLAIYVIMALVWCVPDQRIERRVDITQGG